MTKQEKIEQITILVEELKKENLRYDEFQFINRLDYAINNFSS